MSGKKEVEVFHPSGNLVVTPTIDPREENRKDFILFNGGLPLGFMVSGSIAGAIIPSATFLEGGLIAFGLGLVSSLGATFMTRHDTKGSTVYKGLELQKFSMLRSHLSIGEIKKNTRLHLETFPVRITSDIEITELTPNTEKVDKSQATHTVSHYLVRDKTGFRLEQECIPNHEAIWDASADALAEVHHVNEVKSRYVFKSVL